MGVSLEVGLSHKVSHRFGFIVASEFVSQFCLCYVQLFLIAVFK